MPSSPFLQKLRLLLEFYPGFIYIKIFTDLVFFSGTYFSSGELQFFSGTRLKLSDLGKRYSRNYFTGPIEFYSINWSLMLLLRNLVLYYILIFLFEAILASNQGVSKSLWSILCSCFKTKKASKSTQEYSRLVSPPESFNESKEFEMTPQIESPSPALNSSVSSSEIGIKVDNLSKSFATWSCADLLCCKKSQPVRACREISFEVRKDQLVTVLGQNGAGKTTLINMLAGFLKPNWGEAWLMGKTLSEDPLEIREITSLCPQFDIYWPNLTIREHLEIFSVAKGLHQPDALQAEIRRTLALVDLTDKQNERVEFLSGGMRRRLAIAISTVGDPQIIFFDEPTTGLDPVTKDQILELIKGDELGNERTQKGEDTCAHDPLDGRGRRVVGFGHFFEQGEEVL